MCLTIFFGISSGGNSDALEELVELPDVTLEVTLILSEVLVTLERVEILGSLSVLLSRSLSIEFMISTTLLPWLAGT
jgi:hypothetical protein